ncbi:MAG: AsmA family protein [Methylovirgula sp.]
MRESLTVLAGLLILILSAALVVPYFIDWNAERGLVEAQLSEVLGRPVKIRGAIDLKLLPTPYLRLANVQVGTPAAEPEIKIDEIQLEIALTALLHGEVDFVEAKLVRPQLALTIKDGALPPVPAIQRFLGPMRFDRISVEDGALSLGDPATGRSYAFKNISLSAEAVSLAGPFKAAGRFAFAGQPTDFRLDTGGRNGDRLHFKLIVDENKQHPRADVEADLIFAKSAAGFVLPSVEGQIKLSGHLNGEIMLPWQLSGAARAELHKAVIDDLDLRLGDDDHGMSFNGAAQFDFGAVPRANATLKASQIDLDRLLTEQGSPPAMQRLAHALAALAKSDDPLVSGMPFTLEWSADTAVLGGETLSDLSGGFSVSAKKALRLRFEASGPGRSHLRLDGDAETGSAAGFKGHMAASAGDAARLGQWLGANLPQSAPLFAALPHKSFDVSGLANLSGVGFVGQDLSLRLDQSMLSGTLAYTQSIGGEPARLFADLSATRLDLGSVPDLSSLAGWAKAMDLSLRFDARAVKIGSLGQDSLGQPGLDTGHIQLKLEKTGSLAKLDELTVTGVGGADIHAHGQWDGQAGDITGTVDSEKLDAVTALLHRLAPSLMTDMLQARAADLSPTHLRLSAHGVAGPHGAIALAGFDLTGTAGGTKIATKIATDPQNPAGLILSAQFNAPDALVLIRQLGLPSLPLRDLGAGQVDIAASGSLDKVFAAKLTASLAGTHVAFEGSVQEDLAAPHAMGAVQLDSADLTSLLEATGLAFPDPTMRLAANLKADIDARPANVSLSNLSGRFAGAEIAGHLGYDVAKNRLTGGLDTDRLSLATIFEWAFGPMSPPKAGTLWPSAEFTAAMLDPPPMDLALSAKSFDLWPQMSGREAQFGLEVSGGRAGLKLALHHVAMKLGAGRIAAELTLRRDGASAAASGHLKLADYDLVLPSLRGSLGADLDLAGTGDSAAAVIAGLAGSGTLTFADLVLPRTDPGGMLRVVKAVEDDTLNLDASEIDRALAAEFDKGAAHLGTETFDAGLAAGLLHLTAKETEAKRLEPGVTEALQASLDLGSLTLDQRSRLSLVTLPKNWSGPVPQISLISTGPLTNPVRTIESAAFVNALAGRAIARESARIQAQEFDVHEQAFFYNRLKSERRREQERPKAEQDAKRTAKAKDEAAKAGRMKVEEQQRKAEEATRASAPSVPLPVARPLLLRPAPHRARAAPLPIVRRPVQRPAQTPVFPWTVPVDPLAAGRF